MSLCDQCKEFNNNTNVVPAVLKCTINSNEIHHSFNDRPSMVYVDNNKNTLKRWHKNGKLHRENGPACISTSKVSECKQYFYEGKRVSVKELKEKQNENL